MIARPKKLTKRTFSTSVRNTAIIDNLSLFDATMALCEAWDLEIEVVPKLCSTDLKEEMAVECAAVHMVD